ncbi:hypothetical protein BS47DRAFT_1339786, partial [Hydnum rufescens UP504]
MASLPASSTKTFKGLISLHPCDFVHPGHGERLAESKLSTYTRADPKHDVRAHLLWRAISLQVWTSSSCPGRRGGLIAITSSLSIPFSPSTTRV